jgi:pyrimidine deaminase RibD-like protein
LRKFARKALDQARKSVAEDSTKHHPKVGAVVVKNGECSAKLTAERYRATTPSSSRWS